jgi:hypothetical protein
VVDTAFRGAHCGRELRYTRAMPAPIVPGPTTATSAGSSPGVGCRRELIAIQLSQALVADAEVMRDLVDDDP